MRERRRSVGQVSLAAQLVKAEATEFEATVTKIRSNPLTSFHLCRFTHLVELN